jgi:hypothetical protein
MMCDAKGHPLRVGDEVYCFIKGHGSGGNFGFVIGVMSYATDASNEVVCIASERYSGMPVNTAHLQRTGVYHLDAARLLREMYLKQTPGAFKPEGRTDVE